MKCVSNNRRQTPVCSGLFKQSKAFSLPEFLIALFISSILMTTMFRLYSIVKYHYYRCYEIIKVQKEYLYLTSYLREIIKRSGFTGLGSLSSLTSVNKPEEVQLVSFLIFKKNSEEIPLVVRSKMRSESQGILISYLSDIAYLNKDVSKSQKVYLSSPVSVTNKMTIALINNHKIEFVTTDKTYLNKKIMSLKHPVMETFSKGDVFGRFNQLYLYIKNNSEQPALYWYMKGGQKGEISRAITNMTITKIPSSIYPLVELTLNTKKSKLFIDVSLVNEKI